MNKFINWLFRRDTNRADGRYPTSMQDLRANDPCWCGSNKAYRKCHRPDDRKREKELGLHKKGKSICDAFT